MINCPRCTSPNVKSNKIPMPQDRAMGLALRRAREIHPALFGIGLAVFAGAKGVNHYRKEYRCRDCGYQFNV